jgi:hypothetical protein
LSRQVLEIAQYTAYTPHSGLITFEGAFMRKAIGLFSALGVPALGQTDD